MPDKKEINQQEISGRIPIVESGSSGEILKPLENRPGNKEVVNQIQARLEDIEDGKAPAVDPTIMEAARKAAATENVGSSSRENLKHFLDVLHGSVNDPASTVEEVLAASSGEEIKE